MRGARLLPVVCGLLALGGGARGANAPEDSGVLVVVAHPDTAPRTLTPAELTSVFMGAMRQWPGDGPTMPIVAFNYPPDHALRVAFDRAVLRMSPDEVGRFWLDQRIRGQGRPPRQVPDPELMARLVARVPGALGYVPPKLVDQHVRVIARVVNGKVLPP